MAKKLAINHLEGVKMWRKMRDFSHKTREIGHKSREESRIVQELGEI